MSFKILVVDDSSAMRLIIKSAIQICGLPIQNILQATNGNEGLQVMSKENPDLVLIDLNMPVMGGIEMILQIRQNPNWRTLPLMVISTEFSQERIEEIQQMGIPFIHKPFSAEEIREKIFPLLNFPSRSSA